MILPKHVVLFQVLIYLSLALDAVSVAFQDRTPSAAMSETTIMATSVISPGLLRILSSRNLTASGCDGFAKCPPCA